MTQVLNFIKKYKKSFLVGIPVLLVVIYFIFGRGETGTEAYTVEKTDVTQSVVLSGKVTTSDKADLGFASSGRLEKILVKNNQNVNQGQILAQLEIGDLLADLRIKEAGLRTSDVDLEAAKDELEKTTAEENTKVASAYRTLLTEDLELIPNSVNYTVATPTLGGIYDGPEGEYKITIDKENITSPDIRLLTFGLEKTERVVNEEGSTPLGTKGLYIFFPDNLPSYKDTTWFLDIPNKTSSAYLLNLNAYNEAKDARDKAF